MKCAPVASACVFARTRDGQLDEHGRDRREDHHGKATIGPPPRDRDRHGCRRKQERHAREHGDGAGEGRGDGTDEDVAISDVSEFVSEHAFEFVISEQAENAFRHGNGGVLRISSGGESVGRLVGIT